jgi:hypothetical protein
MNTLYLINELTSLVIHLEKLINELVEENSSLDIDLTEICGYDRD